MPPVRPLLDVLISPGCDDSRGHLGEVLGAPLAEEPRSAGDTWPHSTHLILQRGCVISTS